MDSNCSSSKLGVFSFSDCVLISSGTPGLVASVIDQRHRQHAFAEIDFPFIVGHDVSIFRCPTISKEQILRLLFGSLTRSRLQDQE